MFTLCMEEQLRPAMRFNVIVYSTSVHQWKPGLILATPENRNEACQWFLNQSGGGFSCLLDALRVIHTLNAAGVYLVSDGETSHTHQFILDQLSTCSPSQYRLHTTAYHCQRDENMSFLKKLAEVSGGRFHHYCPHAAQLRGVDEVGDDVAVMMEEVQRAHTTLEQVMLHLGRPTSCDHHMTYTTNHMIST